MHTTEKRGVRKQIELFQKLHRYPIIGEKGNYHNMPKNTDEDPAGTPQSGLPNPVIDDASQGTPLPANEVVGLIKQLSDRMDAAEKRWQADKDRRIPQIEHKLESFESVLGDYEQLVNSGLDANVAKWLIRNLGQRVDQVVQEPPQQQSQLPPGREASTDAASEAVGKLEKYGLSANEPKFIELLRGRYPNTDAFHSAVNSYILERLVPGNDEVSPVGANVSMVRGETHTEPENPIQDVEDRKELYKMAFEQATKKRPSR